MLPARTKCALGWHKPSPARTLRCGDGWISRCSHCKTPMAYLEETGWFRADRTRRPNGPGSRWAIRGASLAIAVIPIQSSAAQMDGLLGALTNTPENRASLSEMEIREFRHSGMHCRSKIDGSNDDAVRQAKNIEMRPQTYVHVETQVWPEHEGRHAFAMAYTVEDATGRRAMHRAFGWLDSNLCTARITHS